MSPPLLSDILMVMLGAAVRWVAVAALGRRVPSSRLLNTVELARLKLHLTSRPVRERGHHSTALIVNYNP
jgi:hypothetical protein